MKYLIDYFDKPTILHIADVANAWELLGVKSVSYIKQIAKSKLEINKLASGHKVLFYKLFVKVLTNLPIRYCCKNEYCEFCNNLYNLKFGKDNNVKQNISRSDLHLLFSKQNKKRALAPPKISKKIDLTKSDDKNGLKASISKNYIRYEFNEILSEPTSFFLINTKGDKTIISLNKEHPFTKCFIDLSNSNLQELNKQQIELFAKKSLNLLKLLLISWAKFEKELPKGKNFKFAKESRIDWGISLRKIIENNEWKF